MIETETKNSSIDTTNDATRYNISLLVITGLLLVFAWPGLRVLFMTYWNNADYSHGFLVPLISLYTALTLWKKEKFTIISAPWLGLPFITAGTALMILSNWYHVAMMQTGPGTAFLCALSLITLILGISLAAGGIRFTKANAFPLGFLLFAVPLPTMFANQITLPLRAIVSAAAAVIIRIFGITVFREGNLLHLADMSLGVADACSGIRSLWVMLAMATAIGYMLKGGFAKILLLTALAVPLSIAVNTLRVVITAMLVTWVDPDLATGTWHDTIGMLIIFMGMIALVIIGKWITPGTAPSDAAQVVEKGRKTPMTPLNRLFRFPKWFYGLLVVLMSGAIFLNFYIDAHYLFISEPDTQRKTLDYFPDRLNGFVSHADLKLPSEQLQVLSPNEKMIRMYEDAEGFPIQVMIFYWEPFSTRKWTSVVGPHVPDVCYPAAGRKRIETFDQTLELSELPGETIYYRVFKKTGRPPRVILFWYKTGRFKWVPHSLPGRLRALFQSWHHALSSNSRYIVTIDVKVATTAERAKRRALKLIKTLGPILPQYGISRDITPD